MMRGIRIAGPGAIADTIRSPSTRLSAPLNRRPSPIHDCAPQELEHDPAGLFDDGVYDDPFASDLVALSGGVKQVFAGGAELQASGSWQSKDFTAVAALDATGLPLAGDPLREDRITRAGVSLSLPVPAPDTFSLALALEYGFTRSRSNDAFYDYRSHAFGIALTLSR